MNDPFYPLRAAGVGVVESLETTNGITPASLFLELYAFYAQMESSRMAEARASDVVDEWITSQLATMPAGERCFLVDNWTPAVRQHRWLCVAPPNDRGWLARLWRAEQPDGVLVMAADASRVVFIVRPCDGYLHAAALATDEVLAMRADRGRLAAVLDATPGLRCVPAPPAPRVLRLSELLAVAPGSTLPVAASDARRDGWIVDVFERWRAERPRLDDRPNADNLGPYALSLAGTERLATFQAYLPVPALLAEIWRRAGFDRLALVDSDFTRSLLISRIDDRYEARFATP